MREMQVEAPTQRRLQGNTGIGGNYLIIFFFAKLPYILKIADIIFLIEESSEGGFIAKGLEVSIFTQEETLGALKVAIIDAIHCHFDDN